MHSALLRQRLPWYTAAATTKSSPSSPLRTPLTHVIRPPAPAAASRSFANSPHPSWPAIQTPMPSIESTVARILPPSVSVSDLNLNRSVAESFVGTVIQQIRGAADATTVSDAQQGWDDIDAKLREVLASQSLPASALTGLSSLLITSSNDPRRHAVAFHLYRVAFGADPAGLPEINLSTSDLQAELPGQASSSTSADDSKWGDWQAAYHWASLVMQGRAPPPPGTTLLPATEQRQAQAKQSSTAYKVFAHLAQQGHPRGIFGIAQQLLSSLDRGVDPTVLGTVAHVPGQEQNTRQERVAEIERLYRQAGEAGVEEAWFQLGALYTEGKWVRKDEGKARGFLQEAVQQGSPRACQALAHLLTREAQAPAPPSSLSGAELNSSTDATLRQDRLEQSLELLERGAQLGSAECAFSAGMRYLLQDTAGNDEASRQADSSASLDLSLDSSDSKRFSAEERAEKARSDHRTKWGVQPDDSIASQWLTQAAEGGNTLAMMNLARMYLEGRAGGEVESSEGATSPRMQQLLHSSSWYSKILAKAMGPEGQRAKALAEVQAKLAQQAKGKGIQQPSETPEPGMSLGSGRLDDLGARAEEGLRVVREELARLTEQK